MVIQKHIIIHGRVQGVGYRAWTTATAKKIGLNGWVRNLTDGTVEALFEGSHEQIDAMLHLCERGPLVAKVRQIETRNTPSQDIDSGFISKPTTDKALA